MDFALQTFGNENLEVILQSKFGLVMQFIKVQIDII
jgi:hypothetical protein